MNIIKNLVDKSKYNIKCPYEMNAEYITVHNTANDASARNEIAYMTSNNNEVSFHLAVDDIEVVQGLPLDRNGWHCGDGNGKGNRKSIGIEICYSKSGGDKFIKAEQNAVELIVQLLKERNWGIDRVKKHQDWSNKYCPHRTLDMGWNRFIKMIEAKLNCSPQSGTQSNPQSDTQVNVFYRVKTQAHGWLPKVKNLEDYAGWQNSPIIGLAIKVDKGSIKYRVHLKNKGWLGYVTGYNINDIINGYAGNGKDVIDAVEVYYNTPSNIRPFKKAKYKVNDYSWQYDNEKTKGQDGYAGAFGVNATKFQIVIE
jgi:N-acetylmuramoyl-L-alanine amidase CwlA